MTMTRRLLLKLAGLAGAGPWIEGQASAHGSETAAPGAFAFHHVQPQTSATLVGLQSTSGVFVPPRGRAFQKFSFDFPEVSVSFAGLQVGARVFTHENVYTLDPSGATFAETSDSIELRSPRLTWAGGQQFEPGSVVIRLTRRGDVVDCNVHASMDRPIKAVATIVRGIPRGRLSTGDAFIDHRDDEVLFGYPFSGGDLSGPQGNAGLTTPLVVVQPDSGPLIALSSLDDRVRTKRFYFQPGEAGYRVEMLVETEGWKEARSFDVPAWRIARASSVADAVTPHYDHIERAFHIPRWDTRPDVPDWLRKTALVVTLHGMHVTGYIFNDYARMLEILKWMATRIPGNRVLVFISAWDGRYYWDYPVYQASDRMGGQAGFKALISGGRALGFKMMPMFGANAANRKRPEFARVSSAFTAKIDDDRMDINWVDWDNDRHQDGWLSYMNLGVDEWRVWLTRRIADAIERYGVDAYFLDIAGGWVNNTKADMHEGMRRMVAELRSRFPAVLCCGEMHYDALLQFIPIYHSFGQTLVADLVQRHARFFQHLSHPAPGRGSTGVHEFGFSRWDSRTLSLSDLAIPTLNVADDTFEKYRDEMDAVIQRAKERAGIS